MTNTAHSLDTLHVVQVQKYSDGLRGHRIVILQDAFGDEGVYYPAQSVYLNGDAIDALRTLLNSLPAS